MLEKEFQQRLRVEANLAGWRSYCTWDSRHSPRGWPDLVLVRPPEIIFAELKSENGRLSLDQQICLERLAQCGLETHVWRPSDTDEILRRLV